MRPNPATHTVSSLSWASCCWRGGHRLGLSQDDWKKGRDRTKGVGMRVPIGTTQDVDQVAARAKAAGISLDTDPHDPPWNSRAVEVTDPSGFKLTISSEE